MRRSSVSGASPPSGSGALQWKAEGPGGPAWLEGETDRVKEYLSKRFALYGKDSRFSCPESCERACCRQFPLKINLSLVDLIGIGTAAHVRPSVLFSSHCRLTTFPTGRGAFVRRIGIELKTPCVFHDGRLCGVHGVRPIACELFPEWVYLSKKAQRRYIGTEPFAACACMAEPQRISKKRSEALQEIQRKRLSEQRASDLVLFSIWPLVVDFRNLLEELIAAGDQILGGPEPAHGATGPADQKGCVVLENREYGRGKRPFIPDEAFCRVLLTHLDRTGDLEKYLEKIRWLDSPKGRGEFISMVKAMEMLDSTRPAGLPVFIHQFEGDALKPTSTR